MPVSRRSTLKAGAHAAWMVPAIHVVSTAPAYAASGDADVQVSDVSSDYIVEGPDAYRPDRLTTGFTLTNNGIGAANDLVVSMVIPGGLYATAPEIIGLPDGYAAGTATGSLAGGWTVPAVRTLPLGPGETTGPQSPFSLQFLDPIDETPYRRWAGDGFTATVLVTSSSAPSTSASDAVDEAPPTFLEIGGFSGSRTEAAVVLNGSVLNVGSRTSGAVELTFWWNPSGATGDRWNGVPSATAVAGPESNLSGGARSGTGTTLDPWTYAFTHDTRATLSSFPLGDIEPGPHCEIPFQISFTLGTGDEEFTGARSIHMLASAPHATVPFVGSDHGYGVTTIGQIES